MKRSILFLLAFTFTLTCLSCGGGGGSSSTNGSKSLVQITLGGSGKPAFKSNSGTGGFRENTIPSDIYKISFTISAPDISTITKDVSVAGQSSITETFSIENGDNRYFLLEAKNTSGTVLYKGSTTVNLDGAPVTLDIIMTAQDVTAPAVISTSPANNATDVAITSAITVTFSETIDSSSFNLTLSDGGGNIAGTTTTNNALVTFTPSSSLSYSTTYTATISSGIQDTAGNTMATNYTWSWTTGAAPDTTAPTVQSTSPGSGATGVSVSNTTITATFSESMDSSTITTATFTVSGVTGTVTYSGTTATFTPSSNLSYSTTYTVTITTGVQDSAGNAMASNYTWQFTTTSSPGTLDTSFNVDGIVVHNNAAGGDGSDYGNSITIDSNGKILVTGYSYSSSGNDDMSIWRYNSDGTLDTTFNSNGSIPGIVVHNSAAGGNGGDSGNSITIDLNGKILVTGYSHNGNNYDMSIWRYNSNGTLDTTFGGGDGIVVHDGAAGGYGGDYGSSIRTDSSGKILVTGYSYSTNYTYDMVIWRYNTNGKLETSFSSDGIVVHDNAAGGNGSDYGNSITIDSNGKILVTGYSSSGDYDDMVIWRYNTDGTLDTTFGGGDGIVVHDGAAGGDSDDKGGSITIDSSGKILVTGYSENGNDFDMVIWRYKTDGTFDTTFGSGGIVVHNSAAGGNSDDKGGSITIDSSGKILVTGYSKNASPNADMSIWRYNTNGTLDTTFDGDGIVVHDSAAGGNSSDGGYSITIDSNGNILVTGSSFNGNNDDMSIWRYIP